MIDLILAIAFTKHLDNSGLDYNEVHPHIRLEVEQYAVGLFINSMGNPTTYASYTWGEDWFLEVGLMDGYQNRVLPYGRAGYELHDNVTLFAAPSIVKGEVGGVVLGLELKL
jgi:hypothetical protein